MQLLSGLLVKKCRSAPETFSRDTAFSGLSRGFSTGTREGPAFSGATKRGDFVVDGWTWKSRIWTEEFMAEELGEERRSGFGV